MKFFKLYMSFIPKNIVQYFLLCTIKSFELENLNCTEKDT